jgi:hypothetical protein
MTLRCHHCLALVGPLWCFCMYCHVSLSRDFPEPKSEAVPSPAMAREASPQSREVPQESQQQQSPAVAMFTEEQICSAVREAFAEGFRQGSGRDTPPAEREDSQTRAGENSEPQQSDPGLQESEEAHVAPEKTKKWRRRKKSSKHKRHQYTLEPTRPES